MGIERWWLIVPLRLRSILRGGRVERELEEELQFHLEKRTEEGMARGLSPEEARAAALRAMQGLEQRKEEMRDMRRVAWLTDFVENLGRDIRYGLRGVANDRGTLEF